MPVLRLLICLTALVLFTSPPPASAQGRAAAVGVQEVAMQRLSETVPVFAEVVTARDGAVASRVAGNVDKVFVLAGDIVAEGDLLVQLNRELAQIRVAQSEAQLVEAEAGIATAQVRLDRANIALERVQALEGSSSFSQGRLDDATSDMLEAGSQLLEAQARQKSSEAQLAETRYQIERGQVKAPFPGVVIEVNTIPGAFTQAGTPLVRLLDTESFEVQASVPARYVADLQTGQAMQANTETGAELTLELRAILPLEDAATRTRAIRLTGPELSAMGNVAVGQSLTVQIPVGPARDVLSVPKDALIQSPNGWTVYVAADDKAQPRPVTLGVPLGDRYEVLGGLQTGDLVVVRGNERLRPGQDITANLVETN